MELIQRRISKAIDQIEKIDSGCEKIGNLLKREPLNRENIEGVASTIDLLVRAHLREIGITSIPIPEKISLHELIDMAVWKIPPFEKSKEKGFKDTIILFSIIDHLRKFNLTNGIFLTNDNIFQSKEIAERFRENHLNVIILKSCKEATEFIKKQLNELVLAKLEAEKERLIGFLQSGFEKISEFIVQNISVSERYLKYESALSTDPTKFYGTLKDVLNITPLEITIAVRSFMRDKYELDDRQRILVGVKTKFDVIVEEYSAGAIFYSKNKFQASENGGFERVSTNEDISASKIEKEMEIYKDISIDIEVTLEDSNYKEFTIKKLHVW